MHTCRVAGFSWHFLKFHYVQRNGLASKFYKKLVKGRTLKNMHPLSWTPLYSQTLQHLAKFVNCKSIACNDNALTLLVHCILQTELNFTSKQNFGCISQSVQVVLALAGYPILSLKTIWWIFNFMGLLVPRWAQFI